MPRKRREGKELAEWRLTQVAKQARASVKILKNILETLPKYDGKVMNAKVRAEIVLDIDENNKTISSFRRGKYDDEIVLTILDYNEDRVASIPQSKFTGQGKRKFVASLAQKAVEEKIEERKHEVDLCKEVSKNLDSITSQIEELKKQVDEARKAGSFKEQKDALLEEYVSVFPDMTRGIKDAINEYVPRIWELDCYIV